MEPRNPPRIVRFRLFVLLVGVLVVGFLFNPQVQPIAGDQRAARERSRQRGGGKSKTRGQTEPRVITQRISQATVSFRGAGSGQAGDLISISAWAKISKMPRSLTAGMDDVQHNPFFLRT